MVEMPDAIHDSLSHFVDEKVGYYRIVNGIKGILAHGSGDCRFGPTEPKQQPDGSFVRGSTHLPFLTTEVANSQSESSIRAKVERFQLGAVGFLRRRL